MTHDAVCGAASCGLCRAVAPEVERTANPSRRPSAPTWHERPIVAVAVGALGAQTTEGSISLCADE
jgi:hypothetical protein